MRLSWTFGLGALLGAGIAILPQLASGVNAAFKQARADSSTTDSSKNLHTEQTFEFVADAPIEIVAPLFGADRERVWAPGWDPAFVWPSEAKDQEGMVFTMAHEHKTAIWINTSFEPINGRVQYAYLIPDIMVTVITLKMTPQEKRTHVSVEYDRTALNTGANDHVQQMADHEGRSGTEWAKRINDYLKTL
jgi:hypothetical protein